MGPVVVVVAVIAVVAVVVGIGYCIWRFRIGLANIELKHTKGENHVECRISRTGSNISGSPTTWKKIQLSQQDKQILQQMTTEEFIQKCKKYVCPITHEVVIDPVAMKCCLGGKLGEKLKVQQWLQTKTTCPLCKKGGQTSQSIVQKNDHIQGVKDSIQILRKRIQITYKKLSPQLRRNLQEIIKKYFGENYSSQHLVQILPSKWQKIKLNPQDLILPKLTKDQLIQQCVEYKCPITHMVLIDPVSMDCCLGKQVAENEELQKWLQKHTTCPLCGKGGQNPESINTKCNQILKKFQGVKKLRKRLQITYKDLIGQTRDEFEFLIFKQFGDNYIQKHLTQVQGDVSSDNTVINQ